MGKNVQNPSMQVNGWNYLGKSYMFTATTGGKKKKIEKLVWVSKDTYYNRPRYKVELVPDFFGNWTLKFSYPASKRGRKRGGRGSIYSHSILQRNIESRNSAISSARRVMKRDINELIKMDLGKMKPKRRKNPTALGEVSANLPKPDEFRGVIQDVDTSAKETFNSVKQEVKGGVGSATPWGAISDSEALQGEGGQELLGDVGDAVKDVGKGAKGIMGDVGGGIGSIAGDSSEIVDEASRFVKGGGEIVESGGDLALGLTGGIYGIGEVGRRGGEGIGTGVRTLVKGMGKSGSKGTEDVREGFKSASAKVGGEAFEQVSESVEDVRQMAISHPAKNLTEIGDTFSDVIVKGIKGNPKTKYEAYSDKMGKWIGVNEYINKGDWYGETYIIGIGMGYDTQIFIVEADNDQSALDTFADSKFAHLTEISEDEIDDYGGDDYISRLGNEGKPHSLDELRLFEKAKVRKIGIKKRPPQVKWESVTVPFSQNNPDHPKLRKNEDVAHHWMSKMSGETKNLFTDGTTIWSYGYHYPIATRHKGELYFNNGGYYSMTTSQHKGLVAREMGYKNWKELEKGWAKTHLIDTKKMRKLVGRGNPDFAMSKWKVVEIVSGKEVGGYWQFETKEEANKWLDTVKIDEINGKWFVREGLGGGTIYSFPTKQGAEKYKASLRVRKMVGRGNPQLNPSRKSFISVKKQQGKWIPVRMEWLPEKKKFVIADKGMKEFKARRGRSRVQGGQTLDFDSGEDKAIDYATEWANLEGIPFKYESQWGEFQFEMNPKGKGNPSFECVECGRRFDKRGDESYIYHEVCPSCVAEKGVSHCECLRHGNEECLGDFNCEKCGKCMNWQGYSADQTVCFYCVQRGNPSIKLSKGKEIAKWWLRGLSLGIIDKNGDIHIASGKQFKDWWAKALSLGIINGDLNVQKGANIGDYWVKGFSFGTAQFNPVRQSIKKTFTSVRTSVNPEMVELLARVTDDGYLLGTTDNFSNGWSESFWSDYYDEGMDDHNPATVLIEVPEDMEQNLLDHGTSAQHYSDGYEAWQDVLKRGKFEDNPARKINQRDYKYYNVYKNKICAGNEYKEDAKDEQEMFRDEMGKKTRVLTKTYLKRNGIDPDKNENWGGSKLMELENMFGNQYLDFIDWQEGEIELWIWNEEDIVNNLMALKDNYLKKKARGGGKYKRERAVDGIRNIIVKRAITKINKSGGHLGKVSLKTKQKVAENVMETLEADYMDNPKSFKNNPFKLTDDKKFLKLYVRGISLGIIDKNGKFHITKGRDFLDWWARAFTMGIVRVKPKVKITSGANFVDYWTRRWTFGYLRYIGVPFND